LLGQLFKLRTVARGAGDFLLEQLLAPRGGKALALVLQALLTR